MSDIFCFNDVQWAKIAPLLPFYKSAAPLRADHLAVAAYGRSYQIGEPGFSSSHSTKRAIEAAISSSAASAA